MSGRGRGHPLAGAFTACRGGGGEPDEAALERRLEALLDDARAAWPGVAVEPARFAAYLGERVAPGAPALEQLQGLSTRDLYLACACADGSGSAIGAFEAAFGADIERAVSRLDGPSTLAEDVRQHLRLILFVAGPGGSPLVATYAGRGDLRAFVRAAAVRNALKMLRKTRRERPSLDDRILSAGSGAPGAGDDPALAYVKRLYSAEFKVAFAEAMEGLGEVGRNLVRYYYVDGLGVEALGALYRVHHTTITRRLAKAREELLARTRGSLERRLGVRPSEIDSILRVIESRLDVSALGAPFPR